MKSKFYLLSIALACVFVGCEKDSENDTGDKDDAKIVNLKNVSISNAQTLFIAESASTSKAKLARAGGDNYSDVGEMVAPKLYKITATGQTYEVEFIDNSGEIIPVKTEHFVNLLGEFVLMSAHYENFGYDENNQRVPYKVEMMLIVSLDDGSVVSADNNSPYTQTLRDIVNVSQSGGNLADFGLQKDKTGAVYFHTGLVLTKIYKANGGVQVSETSLNLGNSRQWMMNYNGDIWYNYYCMKVSGEFIDSDDKLDEYDCFVKESHPGNFFKFFSSEDETYTVENPVWNFVIYKYTPGATKLQRTIDLKVKTDSPISPSSLPLTFINNHLIIISDQYNWDPSDNFIYVIDQDNVVKFYDNSVKAFPRETGLWPNALIRISDNYIYDCAKDWEDRSDPDRNKIRRFNPVDGSVETAYEAPSSYNITSYKVSKDDVMTITALEGATGNPVNLMVKADGTITEHKTYNNQTIYQLERLN